jgi:hypothetical protein
VQTINLTAHQAATALAGMAGLDPRGLVTDADIAGMCQTGMCMGLQSADGAVVMVLQVRDGVIWVDAVRGAGRVDLTAAVDQALTALPGARAVAFQTARPGLVRKAQRLGYQVTGYVMRKDLQ